MRSLPLFLSAALAVSMCSCSLLSQLINIAIPIGLAKLSFSCLPEGTRIDTPDGPRMVETIKAGDTVIGFGGTPVTVIQKHGYMEDPTRKFFTVKFENGSSVDLCGPHRIAGQRAQDLTIDTKIGENVIDSITTYVGVERSYDLLTTDLGYQISGIPVNSMIEEMAQARRKDLEEMRKESEQGAL